MGVVPRFATMLATAALRGGLAGPAYASDTDSVGDGGTRDPDTRTLSTSDQPIEVLQPGADGMHGSVTLVMPCVGSDGAGQTMSFQIIYTATF